MSVILSSQFNRSEYVAAANQAAALREEAARRAQPPHPTRVPPEVLAPDFRQRVIADLSHTYAVVFLVAVGFVPATLLPAAFLPKRPAQNGAVAEPVPTPVL